MNTKLGCLVGLMMAISIGGCGGSSSNSAKNTCNASLTMGTSGYTVTGTTMTLGDVGTPQVTLTRISAGTSSGFDAYGLWQLPTPDANAFGLVADGELDIEQGTVTISVACTAPSGSSSAKATSPATITATDITILSSQSQTNTF